MKRNRTQSSRFAILHIFIAIGFIAILSSCYVQNITDDYKFLRQEARERITLTTGSIDELKDDRAIYLINAQQVKDYCKQHSNVINKWRRYTKLFYKDVTNSNKRINNSKRFFSFKNGAYIGNFSTYEEALKSLQ